MKTRTLSTLCIAIALMTAGLAAAGPPPVPDPDEAPQPTPDDAQTNRTEENASVFADGVVAGVTSGGDFDGDGNNASDALPADWATAEADHVVQAAASGDEARLLAALANGTDPQDPGSLGDFDGDGGSADEQADAVGAYVGSDLLGHDDDSLEGRTITFVENATDVQNHQDLTNGSVYDDANASLVNTTTWSRAFAAWTGSSVWADYNWTNETADAWGTYGNETAHGYVNGTLVPTLNEQLEAYCDWTGPAESQCLGLRQDPVNVTGPDAVVEALFGALDPIVEGVLFDLLMHPPGVPPSP